MKKYILIIVVAVIIIAGAALFYFRDKLPILKSEKGIENNENILKKNDFSINLPEGWVEVAAPLGASATAIDSNEEITDAKAQTINFRSYFSVVYDTLGQRTKEQYYQEIKDSLKSAFPDIVFSREEKDRIDNKETYFLEAEFNQKEIDFYVMLVINMGEKDIWIISFNTLKSSWNNYRDKFYQTAKSFKSIKI